MESEVLFIECHVGKATYPVQRPFLLRESAKAFNQHSRPEAEQDPACIAPGRRAREAQGSEGTNLPTAFAREDLIMVHCTIHKVIRNCGHVVGRVRVLVKMSVSECYVCLAMSLDTAKDIDNDP